MKVFKYCSSFGLKILIERRIKLSRAHLLNDPFELSPLLNPARFTVARAMKFLRQDHEIDSWYRKEGRTKGFTNKKRYRNWYLANLRERVETLMPRVPQNVEDARAKFAETFSQHWRLFCVSQNPSSILMWSHYAKDHTGMVIEFDFSEQPFRSLGDEWIFPVRYSASKATFEYEPDRVDQFVESLRLIVATKSKDWEYEQEVRAIFPSTACSADDFIRIAPRSIRRVILGCRASKDLEARVHMALRPTEMAHVNVEKAVQSKELFQLDFTPAPILRLPS